MKDRVVCIFDFEAIGRLIGLKIKFPVKGEIYTIREINTAPNGNDAYLLNEIVNPPHRDFENREPDFGVVGFRPVDDSYGEWVEATVLQDAILEETLNPIPL